MSAFFGCLANPLSAVVPRLLLHPGGLAQLGVAGEKVTSALYGYTLTFIERLFSASPRRSTSDSFTPDSIISCTPSCQVDVMPANVQWPPAQCY